jgi:NhaP-type Na+/H+ or K+/H+ antiporter
MHSGTSLHLRRLAVWPAGWLAYFAGVAGAASVALTLIATASEHYVEGAVAGICAVVLITLSIVSLRAIPHISDAHTKAMQTRRDHAVYRARYPL